MKLTLAPHPSILVIKMSAMGDLIHTLPFVQHLRQATGARITWVVDVGLADLLREHPAIDSIVEFPRDPYARTTLPRAWLSVLTRFPARLRRESFDLAIDMQGLARSWVVLLLARSKFKIARGRYPFADRTVPHRRSIPRHASLACFEALDSLDFSIPRTLDELAPATFGASPALAQRESRICLLQFTTWPAKHWTWVGWAELADRLIVQGNRVTVLGGMRDVSKVGEIRRLMKCNSQLEDLCGQTRLPELKRLFANSSLAVGLDTGPLHVAWASGCPTVSLYGASDPLRTAPWPASSHVSIRAPDCRSCCRKHCPKRCLEGLPGEKVISEVEGLLDRLAENRPPAPIALEVAG